MRSHREWSGCLLIRGTSLPPSALSQIPPQAATALPANASAGSKPVSLSFTLFL